MHKIHTYLNRCILLIIFIWFSPPNLNAQPMINGVGIPSDFPEIEFDVLKTTAPGKIFISNITPPNYLLIFENDGTPFYYKRIDGIGFDFKKQATGTLTYWSAPDNYFLEMDSNYTILDTLDCGPGYTADPHELLLLENGNYLLIAIDYRYVDMSVVIAGGSTNAKIKGTHVQELNRAGDVIFEWLSWDHFNITDAVHEDLTAQTIDYVHMNAIAVDYDNNLLISSRHLSEITKIDRVTGEIIWRLGGQNNQFEFINDQYSISYQHAIRPVPGEPDHYTLFDNGNYHSPKFSRVLELKLDTDLMTADKIWEYRSSPDIYSQSGSNAQRLSNGNTLINWAQLGLPKAMEVTPNREVVYQMDFTEPNRAYRTFRFPWAGMSGRPYLIVEPYQDRIRLIFNKFGDRSIKEYVIYAGLTKNERQPVDTTINTYTDLIDLKNNTSYFFQVTAIDSFGNESPPSDPEEVYTNFIGPLENMLLNGDFSDGTDFWKLQVTDPAGATGNIVNGVYTLRVENSGSDFSQIQLRQERIVLREGLSYTLEFDSWGSQSGYIDTKIEQSGSPWTNYSQTGPVYLTNMVRHFEYTFKMAHPSDFDARLVFSCGRFSGIIYLDNVRLVEKSARPLVREQIPDTTCFEDSGPCLLVEDVSLLFYDPNTGDSLTYTVSADNPRIKTSLRDLAVYGIPDTNFAGAGNIAVTATDLTGLRSRDIFKMMIIDINDAPFFKGLPDSIFMDDTSYVLNIWEKVTDLESPDSLLGFSFDAAATDTINLTYDDHSGDLTIYIPGFNRTTAQLLITVQDDSGAAVSDSIFIQKDNLTEIFSDPDAFPTRYSLEQNYPNPFNPATTIVFSLPGAEYVRLMIFDIRGKKVAELISGKVNPGIHRVQFDGSNLSTGIYYYRLQAGSYQASRKMILLK